MWLLLLQSALEITYQLSKWPLLIDGINRFSGVANLSNGLAAKSPPSSSISRH